MKFDEIALALSILFQLVFAASASLMLDGGASKRQQQRQRDIVQVVRMIDSAVASPAARQLSQRHTELSHVPSVAIANPPPTSSLTFNNNASHPGNAKIMLNVNKLWKALTNQMCINCLKVCR